MLCFLHSLQMLSKTGLGTLLCCSQGPSGADQQRFTRTETNRLCWGVPNNSNRSCEVQGADQPAWRKGLLFLCFLQLYTIREKLDSAGAKNSLEKAGQWKLTCAPVPWDSANKLHRYLLCIHCSLKTGSFTRCILSELLTAWSNKQLYKHSALPEHRLMPVGLCSSRHVLSS